MSKPKVGFYWCASCGGCEEAIVDLHEDILGVVEAVDIVFWPCAMDFKREDVEAMADGEMTACFINGAIRSSEQLEMVQLLRKKTQVLISFGSCSHTGGIPGLANLFNLDGILKAAYGNELSTTNPDYTLPQRHTKVAEGELELPTLHENVKSLDQVVDVEYYIPGCAPPKALIMNAVSALLSGNLPPKGTVLAPDVALCDECARIDTKPDKMLVSEFHRPHEIVADTGECLLKQGLFCLGPVTRSGCGAACIEGNMPCTGCGGGTSRIKDFGAKALSAFASVLDATEDSDIAEKLSKIADPVGTFYRYSLPNSTLFSKTGGNGHV